MNDVEPTWLEMRTDLIHEAHDEYRKREPHLIKKHANARAFNRYRSQLFGYIVEAHVYNFLDERLPGVVKRPANYKKYETGCNHDLVLEFASKRLEVDVFGQTLYPYVNGEKYYEMSRGKPKADLYIFARIVDGWNPLPMIAIDGCATHDVLQEYLEDTERIYPYGSLFWTVEQIIMFVNKRIEEAS